MGNEKEFMPQLEHHCMQTVGGKTITPSQYEFLTGMLDLMAAREVKRVCRVVEAAGLQSKQEEAMKEQIKDILYETKEIARRLIRNEIRDNDAWMKAMNEPVEAGGMPGGYHIDNITNGNG